MANQPEDPAQETYPAGIYQWEVTDPCQGGVGGIDNLPLLQLADRTGWLYRCIGALQALAQSFAPLNSAPLTGSPTVPTRAAGDNSAGIANTAWVNQAIANGLAGTHVAPAYSRSGQGVSIGANFSGTQTVTFRAPCNGYIVSSAAMNMNVATPLSGVLFALTMETTAGGYYYVNDQTGNPMVHHGILAIAAGEYAVCEATVSSTANPDCDVSWSVLAFFVPYP
jgi:hypothetical protein